MKQIITEGIVLSRTNYGEADRIITLITPDQGKVRVLARGVRKVKSKMAGGIELFSISQVTFIPGRGDIHTLVSTRLKKHWGNMVQDISRTMLGYELLKRVNRTTEDAAESDYFDLLSGSIEALNCGTQELLVELWFDAQLIKLSGRQPNLSHDVSGQKLLAEEHYNFDFAEMVFVKSAKGRFGAGHIKVLRLLFGLESPNKLAQVQEAEGVFELCRQLVTGLRHHN